MVIPLQAQVQVASLMRRKSIASCQAVKGRHSNCKSSGKEEELWADLANQGKEAAGGAGP